MTGRWLWLAWAAVIAPLAACGPDCSAYCAKLVECQIISAGQEGNCLTSCDETGGDNARIIGCVISHTCPHIAVGDCSVTGQQ